MPNVNPNAPGIAPGTGTNPNKYPQWGVGGGTPGSSSGWNIVEAKNAQQKNSYLAQGYDVWFDSLSSAQSFLGSEKNPLSSGEPQNAIPGLAAIGDFFARLTEGSTWIRAAEITIGIVLIAVGVAKMTHAVPIATAIAKKVS